MSKTLTLAEALRELKRVDKLLQQRYANIRRYCSKRKGTQDEISNQKGYVADQFQSAKDLLVYYTQIRLNLNRANLEATFTFDKKTYTIAEAILYKQYLNTEYNKLYGSFVASNAQSQMSQIRIQTNVGFTPEQLVALNMVPELYYNEKAMQRAREQLLLLMSTIDAKIDSTNHKTTITIS